MDFFNAACQEPPLNDLLFGLCDDQNGTKAYPNTNNTDAPKWIATVKNDNRLEIIFTAIDKCVLKDHEEPGRGRCDVMLTTTSSLFLIELKDASWAANTDALDQLVSTINFLKQHHNRVLDTYIHKKVFVCNKKKRQGRGFVYIDNEENKVFRREHGFRIDIQAEIIIAK